MTESDGKQGPQGGRRVLIVDEHPVVGEVLAEVLCAHGFDAAHCPSVADALMSCELGLVDAVLAEIGLSTPDGRDFAQVMAQQYRHIPYAAVTSWLDHPAVRHLPDLGCRMLLVKPVCVETLPLAVTTLLETHC